MAGLGAPEARETLEVPIEGESPWTSHEPSPSPHPLIYQIEKMDWVVKIK